MCSGKKSLKWLAVKPFQHLAKVFLFGPSNKKSEDPPVQPMILKLYCTAILTKCPISRRLSRRWVSQSLEKKKRKVTKGA